MAHTKIFDKRPNEDHLFRWKASKERLSEKQRFGLNLTFPLGSLSFTARIVWIRICKIEGATLESTLHLENNVKTAKLSHQTKTYYHYDTGTNWKCEENSRWRINKKNTTTTLSAIIIIILKKSKKQASLQLVKRNPEQKRLGIFSFSSTTNRFCSSDPKPACFCFSSIFDPLSRDEPFDLPFRRFELDCDLALSQKV